MSASTKKALEVVAVVMIGAVAVVEPGYVILGTAAVIGGLGLAVWVLGKLGID